MGGNIRLADGAAADALTRTVAAGVRVVEAVSEDDPVEAEEKVYDELLEAAAVTAGVDAVAAEVLVGVAAGDVPAIDADAVVAGLVTDAGSVGDAAMVATGDMGTAGLAASVAAGVVAADTGGEVVTGAGVAVVAGTGVAAGGGDVTPAVAVGELTRMGGGGEGATKLEGEGDAYGDGTCRAIQQTMTSAEDAIEGIIRACYALAAACGFDGGMQTEHQSFVLYCNAVLQQALRL